MGVKRQAPCRTRTLVAEPVSHDESPSLALLAEAHILDLDQRGDGEGVIDRQYIDIAWGDARHGVGGRSAEDLRSREKLGLQSEIGPVIGNTLANAKYSHRRM